MNNKIFLIISIVFYAIASIGFLTVGTLEAIDIIDTDLFYKYSSICVLIFDTAIAFLIFFLPQKLKWLKLILTVLIIWLIIFGFIPLITGMVGNLLVDNQGTVSVKPN